MKMILGQGNPETKYTNTRHNVGFAALHFYAEQQGVTFQSKPKFDAEIAELNINDEKILLVKPTTYYNETGRSARALVDFYKIDSSDIIVIHDDLALPFGTLRTREKGSSAGNNGIKSLNAHLGEEYARIRVGIWNDIADKQPATDFVLSKFTADESDTLKNAIHPRIAEYINSFIAGTHTSTSITIE